MFDSDRIWLIIILLAAGAWMIRSGWSAQQGQKHRGEYLFKGGPGLPPGYIYVSYPIGIFVIILGLTGFLPDPSVAGPFITVTGFVLVPLGLILMILEPRALKPWWLIWLEDHHSSDQLAYLLEVARQMGERDFQAQTPTEEALAAWAEQVLQGPRNVWE